MPNLASGDVLRYEIRYTQQSQRYLNGIYLRYLDTDGVVDDYAFFANKLLDFLEGSGKILPSLQDVLSSTISIDSHQVQKVYPTRLAPITRDFGELGLVGTGPAPVNTALTLTKRSISATRWGIGSWHQPGLNVADMVNSGHWGASIQEALSVALANSFVGLRVPTGAVGSYQGIIWNHTAPTRKTDILSFFPRDTIRTMYRRTVRVGE